jgi:hypothetical protein
MSIDMTNIRIFYSRTLLMCAKTIKNFSKLNVRKSSRRLRCCILEWRIVKLFDRQIGRVHDLFPFFCLIDDEFSEIVRRPWNSYAAKISKPF